ncbi:MAG: hypothetical protein H8D22_00710 [Candidatus Cloacimonetes bacterium]|nr:hypothetical protein [Candidatus Cloacimonadota bacterium]
MSELLTIKQASKWASEYLKKNVTPSNISYLIQYGRINKNGNNGITLIDKQDLIKYYKSYLGTREINWKDKLGDDLNWALSFENYKEKETTKHIHRLHPYKGKFIPQLVEYFLDAHTDNFKKEVFFNSGDIILDPFCGCGTTLVQANELGMHAIGIDISAFNSLISNVKISKYDFVDLHKEIQKITQSLRQHIYDSNTVKFETKLLEKLAKIQKIQGIFSSPPYVGLIDYHEQHAYAYDLFGFDRNDELEIGPLFKGQGIEARNSYIDGITKVLNNIKKYLVDDYNVFLVANDKYNLYPNIAEKSGMKIVNKFKRPVLNRTEKDKGAYSEIIFQLKSK